MNKESGPTGKKKKKVVATAIAVVLAAALMIGGTISYLMGATDDLVNTFTGNSNSVDITESTGNGYDIVPGTSDKKDPTVTASATVDSYLYLVVYDNTDGLVDYEIDTSVWTLLYEVDADGNYTGGTVYYTTVSAGTTSKGYNVLKDQTVYYSADITNEDLADIESLTLSFEAYIIQQASFEVYDDGNLDVSGSAKNAFAYAYYEINDEDVEEIVYVSSAEELEEALSNLSSGDYIILTSDVTTVSAITIEGVDSVTIDLAGNDLTADSIYVSNSGSTYASGVVITSSKGDAVFTSTNSSYAIQVIYGDIEEISNITIDASASTYGIYLNGHGAGIDTIENVTISGGEYGIYAFKVNASDNDDNAISTISDSTISGTYCGIWLTSSYIDLIEDCTISGGSYGVYMRATESSYTTGANIEDSTITGGKDALVMDCYGSSSSVITANLTECTLSGDNYAIEYNLYFTIDLKLDECTIGSTTGDYTLYQTTTGGTGTYKQITESDLTTDPSIVKTESALTSAIASCETVTLAANIELSSTLEITSSSEVETIDLAGYSLTCDSDTAISMTNANVTIKDNSSDGSGTISGTSDSNDSGGAITVSGGTLTVTGGTISGTTTTNGSDDGSYTAGAIYVSNNGTFNFTGGTISGSSAAGYMGAGAVYVTGGSTFTMSDGAEITNCGSTNTSSGKQYCAGAVIVTSSSTFTMSGGTISGCSLGAENQYGTGGVLVDNSTFTMSGGTVSYCTGSRGGAVLVKGSSAEFELTGGTLSENDATYSGGAVYIYYSGTMTMSSGSITSNTCSSGKGGGIRACDGTNVTITGGTISGNTANSGNNAYIDSGCTLSDTGSVLSDYYNGN